MAEPRPPAPARHATSARLGPIAVVVVVAVGLLGASWAVVGWLSPARPSTLVVLGVDAEAGVEALRGVRVYADLCARCHGEDGRGLPPSVPPLPGSIAVAAAGAAAVLEQVVASKPGSLMPAFGGRLALEDVVAVTNHVRGRWGPAGESVELRHRTPPDGLEVVERRLREAAKSLDSGALAGELAAGRGRSLPRLVRPSGTDARGVAAVRGAWAGFFDELRVRGARVEHLSHPGTRYHYDPLDLGRDGALVVAAGEVVWQVGAAEDRWPAERGGFLRVYVRRDGRWGLLLDYAEVGDPRPTPEDG